ncbi:MAG: hypothetical protein H7X97_01350 [Opitutaceae bacterium]|nr:hypothetical protein [Verrucomicrobiales bacterium]
MTFGSITRQFCGGSVAILGLCVLLTGCSRRDSAATTAKDVSDGQISMSASTNLSRVKLAGAPLDDSWRKEPYWILQTELSPFTVFHSSSNYLGFFTGLTNSEVGAPAYAAFISNGGQKVFRNGDAMEASSMGECWVLVWFAGAKGWTNWDMPWVVFLQNKPSNLWLNESGLHFQFKQQAGNVVLMPFYGYERMALKDKPFPKVKIPGREDVRKRPVQTWEWAQVVSQDALMRVRYWAGMSRCIPVYCEDTFSLDRARDSVTIRQRFEWLKIEDEWGTRPVKVAPLSPVLGQAIKDKRLIMEFSKAPLDYDLLTPWGPYYAIEGVDSYDATVPLQKYLSEMRIAAGRTNSPLTVASLAEGFRRWVSGPLRFENLIMTGEGIPFSLGAEREVTSASTPLTGGIDYWDEPQLSRRMPGFWPRMKCGTETFGEVSMIRDGQPPKSTLIPLNWNTQIRVLTPQ